MSDKKAEFDAKLKRAFVILEAAGVGKNSYSPPLYRIFWKCGLRVPPPQMSGFMINAILMGAFFAIGWGALMWVIVWSWQDTSLRTMVVASALAGLLFGLAMAAYARFTARRLMLPEWRRL